MAQPTYHEVLQENRLLRQALAEKDRRIAELEARVAALEAQLEALARGAKRQAAPFSKGPPAAEPRRPGRKPGGSRTTPGTFFPAGTFSPARYLFSSAPFLVVEPIGRQVPCASAK